jgi:hypothetical protein
MQALPNRRVRDIPQTQTGSFHSVGEATAWWNNLCGFHHRYRADHLEGKQLNINRLRTLALKTKINLIARELMRLDAVQLRTRRGNPSSNILRDPPRVTPRIITPTTPIVLNGTEYMWNLYMAAGCGPPAEHERL